MNRQEYDRARKKIEEKHMSALASDLASLDTVYSILKDDAEIAIPATSTHLPRHQSENRGAVAKGEVIDGAREIFKSNKEREFTIADVTEMLVGLGVKTEKPSVSGAVMRLVKQGVIEITEPGIGRKPGKFRLKA